jgi:hypothetical protein
MKPILFLLALSVLFTSCEKLTNKNKLKYTITAAYDATVDTGATINVQVAKKGGKDEIVTLSAIDAPANMVATIEPGYDRPPFTATVKMALIPSRQNVVADWKSYSVTISGISEKGEEASSAPVAFTYYPADAAKAFVGHTFHANIECSPIADEVNTVKALANGPNKIILKTFYATTFTSYDVPATLDPKTKAITIPSYTQSGITFAGSGTFYAVGDKVNCTISFTRTTSTSTSNCSAILEQWD